MTLGSRMQDLLYRAASGVLLLFLRLPLISRGLSYFAKVWLRHARLARHLRVAGYDQVVDAGANIGEFAALVRSIRPDVDLLCVEPHPLAAATLRRRGFRVVEAALWRERGTAVLHQPTGTSTSSTVMGTAAETSPRWNVQTLRLDQMNLQGKSILLKLDLQGAEEPALLGLGDLWSRLDGVLLEVSYGPRGTYESLRALLAARGFAEAATMNELEVGDRVVEADKLWLRIKPEGT